MAKSLCWEFYVGRHGLEFLVALLRCSPLSKTDLQGRYVGYGRRVQDDAFLVTDQVLPCTCRLF
jgi:hypothetical protein